MTTIAYKDGIIAYDSRSTMGNVITNDNTNKKIEREGIIFFMSGAVGDAEEVIEAYLNQEEDCETRGHFNECFVVDNGIVYRFGGNSGETWFVEAVDCPFAIGSGMDFALAAMDLGCSAKEAVKVAAKRDIRTGGKIKEYKVK